MQGETGIIDYKKLRLVSYGNGCSFTQEEIELSEKYAALVSPTKIGVYDSQEDQTINESQAKCGKIAEGSVYKMLEHCGCTKPDYNVYAHATFDPDLYIGKYKLHVKSVNALSPHGISFTFQNQPGRRVDRIFDIHDEYDIIIGCVVSLRLNYTVIADIQPWGYVKPRAVFIDGKDKPYLKGKKLFYTPENPSHQSVKLRTTEIHYWGTVGLKRRSLEFGQQPL